QRHPRTEVTHCAGDAAGDEMGSAGFFHGGAEREHAENHVENSPLDSAARFLDIETAREDDEDRGDKRERGNGQHVKRSEHNHAEDSKDRERRFVPAKRALCWFRETEEVALLHEPMNRFRWALHQQRVTESQLDVLKMFPQVFALAMHCQDEHSITLLEIELMQRLAQKKWSDSREFLPSGCLAVRQWLRARGQPPIGKPGRTFPSVLSRRR